MRLWLFAGYLCAAAQSQSQSPPQTPPMTDVEKAQGEISRLADLYQQGAVSRNRVREAKALVDDANDDAILRRTLYGAVRIEELTPDQIPEMLGAAKRRVDRMQPRIETKQQLVDAGVLARVELKPEIEELELRQLTLESAESRAKTFELLLDSIRAEEEAMARAEEARRDADKLRRVDRYDGSGTFRMAMLKPIEQAFEKKFDRPLPISALGMTELHRSLGFDHSGRVDVALTPDSPEGIWLRQYLESNRVPYFAFRSFIPGQATGAHIHIGPPSLRLVAKAWRYTP